MSADEKVSARRRGSRVLVSLNVSGESPGLTPSVPYRRGPFHHTVKPVADPARILLVRPSALGDVCRSVPLLVSLARRWPGAQIDWLVRDEYIPAVAAHPDLGEAVSFPRRNFRAWWRHPGVAVRGLRWMQALRGRHYDLVIDAQGLLRSGLFAMATGAPRRVGYANAAEFGWIGLTTGHSVPREMHAVDRMLTLLEREGLPIIPDMRLYTRDEDRAALHPRLREARRALVVAPGSRWPGKRWPAKRFATLIERLLAEGLTDVVALVGAPAERAQCDALIGLARREPRMLDLIGRTSVGGLMATVEAASLVVANDSAALHMAVGFGRPIVALFGPTRVDLVGPYRRPQDVLQRVAPGERLDHKDGRHGRAMMDRLAVDDVLDAARERLLRLPDPQARTPRARSERAVASPVGAAR